MTSWTMDDLERAARAGWAADTCSPDDAAREPWTAANPAWGHCDVTALAVHDLLGGDLMLGEVRSAAGEEQGYHYWNRLPSGVEVDFTREQFRDGQSVTAARPVQRPPGRLPRRAEEYDLFRDRMTAALARRESTAEEFPMPTNERIAGHRFLKFLYADEYYPDHVLDKGKAILLRLCERIEAERPADLAALYVLTEAATEEFNELENDFDEAGSEIETVAREEICEDFRVIADAYGFTDADPEALVSGRNW